MLTRRQKHRVAALDAPGKGTGGRGPVSVTVVLRLSELAPRFFRKCIVSSQQCPRRRARCDAVDRSGAVDPVRQLIRDLAGRRSGGYHLRRPASLGAGGAGVTESIGAWLNGLVAVVARGLAATPSGCCMLASSSPEAGHGGRAIGRVCRNGGSPLWPGGCHAAGA